MRGRRFFGLGVALGAAGLFACTSLPACTSADADLGADARLQVSAATFQRGPFPTDSDGPAVLATYLGLTRLEVGQQQSHLSGVVEADSTAVLMALEGDVGVWQLSVSVPPPEAPGALGFVADFSLSGSIAAGAHRLVFWAVDEQGQVGEPASTELEVAEPSEPEGQLVVSLAWEGSADLDLHLVLPSGAEVFAGDPVLRVGDETLAYLDFDANADCVLGGLVRENVVFPANVPAGEYVARVVTRSLCAASSAPFEVEAVYQRESLDAARGVGLAVETRFSSGRGAGELVLTFDIP